MPNYHEQVLINASPTYLPEQSSPLESNYTWAYTISISNTGEEIIQLLDRYWKITDATGHISEVEGPGVIGLQPIIKPGSTFVYSSICQLPTRSGAMAGYYTMQTLDEISFEAPIRKFALISLDTTRPYEKIASKKVLH